MLARYGGIFYASLPLPEDNDMTHPFRIRFVLWLVPLTLAMPALAQEAEEAGEDEEEDRETIADLTENSDRFDGLFTLYRDRDTGETHMAVLPGHLDKEYIYVSVVGDGVVEGGAFRGNYRENRVLSVVLRVLSVSVLEPLRVGCECPLAVARLGYPSIHECLLGVLPLGAR